MTRFPFSSPSAWIWARVVVLPAPAAPCRNRSSLRSSKLAAVNGALAPPSALRSRTKVRTAGCSAGRRSSRVQAGSGSCAERARRYSASASSDHSSASSIASKVTPTISATCDLSNRLRSGFPSPEVRTTSLKSRRTMSRASSTETEEDRWRSSTTCNVACSRRVRAAGTRLCNATRCRAGASGSSPRLLR
jgi:hypothetical protein